MLAGALYACESVRDRAFTVDLNERDLLALTRDYNACLGYDSDEAPSGRRRSSFAFGVTPRLGVGAASVVRAFPPALPSRPESASRTDALVGPFVGVQLEQVFLYVPNRLSLLAELSAQEKSEVGYVNVRLGVRYAVPAGPVAVFGGVGASSGRAVFGTPPCSAVLCNPGPVYEGGAFGEVGVEVPFQGGPLVIGVQLERTVLGGVSPLTVLPGVLDSDEAPVIDNRSLTLVVGKRFGG